MERIDYLSYIIPEMRMNLLSNTEWRAIDLVRRHAPAVVLGFERNVPWPTS